MFEVKRKGIAELTVVDRGGYSLRLVATTYCGEARLGGLCVYSQNGTYVTHDDARALAAALVEWADGVDPQDRVDQ